MILDTGKTFRRDTSLPHTCWTHCVGVDCQVLPGHMLDDRVIDSTLTAVVWERESRTLINPEASLPDYGLMGSGERKRICNAPDVSVSSAYELGGDKSSSFILLNSNVRSSRRSDINRTKHYLENTDPVLIVQTSHRILHELMEVLMLSALAHNLSRFHIVESTYSSYIVSLS